MGQLARILLQGLGESEGWDSHAEAGLELNLLVSSAGCEGVTVFHVASCASPHADLQAANALSLKLTHVLFHMLTYKQLHVLTTLTHVHVQGCPPVSREHAGAPFSPHLPHPASHCCIPPGSPRPITSQPSPSLCPTQLRTGPTPGEKLGSGGCCSIIDRLAEGIINNFPRKSGCRGVGGILLLTLVLISFTTAAT